MQIRAEATALRENAQRAMRQMQAAQQAQQQAQQQQHEMFLQQNLPGGPGGRLRLAAAPPLSIMGPDGMPLTGRLFGAGGLRAALGNAGRLGGRDLANASAAARAANAAAEPEGPPPLDEADLSVLISLLRTSLPLSKQHLQKLFLNLAAHSSSREQLLKMLLSLLRSLPGTSAVEGAEAAADEASDSMQTGTSGRVGMDISEDGSSQQQQVQQLGSQGLSAALDRLGAVEQPADAAAAAAATAGTTAAGVGVMSVGLSGSPQGKPAIVSRRVLDMLSYLSRNSSPVSRKMLSLRIPEPSQAAALEADAKGKGKMVVPSDAEAAQPPRAIEVLLAMLSAPLCQRSVSLLEQLMLLMEVVLTMVQRHEADLAALAALEEAQEQQREAEAEQKRQRERQQREREQAAQQAAQPQQQGEQPAAAAEPSQQQDAAQQAAGAVEQAAQQQPQQQRQQQQDQPSVGVDKQQEQKQKDSEKQRGKKHKQKQAPPSELATTMASIPANLLRQLPGLLAREVLSEPAYASIAKVIKLIVESAPAHLPLMLSELVEGAAGVADALLGYLDTAAQRGIDADAQLAPAIGTKSSVVLRMLYALQGFQTEVQERIKQQKEQQQKEQEVAAAEAASGTTAGTSGATAAAAGSSGAAGGSSSGAAAGPSSSAAAGASSSAAAAATSVVQNVDAAAAAAEVDKVVQAVAARTAPLWKSLSSCILRIEDNLRAVLPQHTQAGGESVGNAAARLLPPGAQQVLPLVEAFFVLCALQGAIPAAAAPAKDLLSAPSLNLDALMPSSSSGTPAAAGAGTPSAGAAATGGAAGLATAGSLWRPGSMSLGEAGASAAGGDVTLPFLKFAERHRRLLNAYIRRNTSLLESSLAPLLRVPKLIDFDNKRSYFRYVCAVVERCAD